MDSSRTGEGVPSQAAHISQEARASQEAPGMARPIPATTTTTVTPGTSATAATPVAPGPHHGPSGLRRWLLLLMVSLGLLLVTVDITILLTALP
ncbi:MAG: hypothetical protein D8H96_16905, partial [Lautropia sp.]